MRTTRRIYAYIFGPPRITRSVPALVKAFTANRLAAVAMCGLGSAGVFAGDDIVLENKRVRAVLGPDAVWQSLVEKSTGRELLAPQSRCAFATATFEAGVKAHDAGTGVNVLDQQKLLLAGSAGINARNATWKDNRLIIGFDGVDTTLTFLVHTERDWITFALESVSGRRPAKLEFLRLAIAPAEHVGPRLAAAWDEKLAVGLAAINLQTQASARRNKTGTLFSAATQDAPGPRLEGAGGALVVTPKADYTTVLARLASAFRLPANPSKDQPMARESYWFLAFGEAEVEKVIACCRQSGFRQVMLSSGSWCASAGHYLFNTKLYPDGLESLRRTVAKLHDAGIRVGMHCYASKVAKIDPYVTPVPDRRFWADRTATLAADIGATDTEIRTATDLREWPGSPVASQTVWEGGVTKHQEIVLDDEIIQYQSIRSNTLLDCKRGAWRTQASAHKAGTVGRHYAVDGCINGYIIDQETALLDEVTTRLADIFNTCGFDMVYFDGGEDVDRRRFTYYVSKFQAAAMSRFKKRPLVHMGTILTHNLWHSFTRSATVDTYLNTLYGAIGAGEKVGEWPTVRQHIDKSVDYMLSVRDDMLPGELGWFGIWPRGKNTDGLQLDEAEYLMVKSLAYDALISLQTSFKQMESHPLTPAILEIVRGYETLRMSGRVDAATRERLKELGKDFALIQHDGRRDFVEMTVVPNVRGTNEIRALVGELNGRAVATLWHCLREAELQIALNPKKVRLLDLGGREVPFKRDDGVLRIPATVRRCTLLCDGVTKNELVLKILK